MSDENRALLRELTREAADETDRLAEKGNELFDEERYDEALAVWQSGLSLIPEPRNMYSESVWFETSIGDIYFLRGEFEKAHRCFDRARSNVSGDGYANPFVMMRLGQSCLELGQQEQAAEYLMRAYMLDGEAVFENEDSKYLDFLRTKADIGR